jgi:hypothetical protein
MVMKKILALVLALASVSAMAQHHHHHHGYWQRGGGNGWMWVAPTIIGGVIGYELARQQPVNPYQPPPIYVNGNVINQPPVIVQLQPCSPWTEVLNPDGTITRTRTCTQ